MANVIEYDIDGKMYVCVDGQLLVGCFECAQYVVFQNRNGVGEV